MIHKEHYLKITQRYKTGLIVNVQEMLSTQNVYMNTIMLHCSMVGMWFYPSKIMLNLILIVGY